MRIGILAAPGLPWEDTYQFFAVETAIRDKDQIRLVSCDELSFYDLLIIPDSGGYDLSSEAFFPHHAIPMDYPGQNQFVARFGKFTLPYYLRKQIKVLGIGHSAHMLWDLGLQGKLTFKQNSPVEILRNTPTEDNSAITMFPENDPNTIFRSPTLWGVDKFRFTGDFYVQVMKYIRKPVVTQPSAGDDAPEMEFVPV